MLRAPSRFVFRFGSPTNSPSDKGLPKLGAGAAKQQRGKYRGVESDPNDCNNTQNGHGFLPDEKTP
jgi:hypothetical protein